MASNKHPGGGGGAGGTPLFTSGFPTQSTVSQSGLNIAHAITTTPTPSLHLPLSAPAVSRIATASPLALPVTIGASSSGERITLQAPSVHHASQLAHASLQPSHITAVRVVSHGS